MTELSSTRSFVEKLKNPMLIIALMGFIGMGFVAMFRIDTIDERLNKKIEVQNEIKDKQSVFALQYKDDQIEHIKDAHKIEIEALKLGYENKIEIEKLKKDYYYLKLISRSWRE
jgi:L-fucose isomerase-like protein